MATPTNQGSTASTFEVGPDEAERIRALRAQGILDSQPSECFDRITSLTSRVLDCPAALISFVDSERVWFKSNVGFGDISELHRNESMCNNAILPSAPDVTAVLDATRDEIYCTHPAVIRAPYLRFYAGAPIKITHEGKTHKIGMVCVTSKEPRATFELCDKQFLLDMASIVADEIELFRKLSQRVMEENQRYITCTAHDLQTPLQAFRYSIDAFKEHFKEQPKEREKDALASDASERPYDNYASPAELDTKTSNEELDTKTSKVWSNIERSSKSFHVRKRGRSISAHHFVETQSTRLINTPAADHVTDMMDVVLQAEGACNMMSETVSNAIDAARARWTRVDGEGYSTSSAGRGFIHACNSNTGGLRQRLVDMDVVALVKDCRRLSVWHHSESVDWTEDIEPEVISSMITYIAGNCKICEALQY